ncbi:MAG: hypothetical protein JXB88_13675 [Spirochaetales bacterium]|nr:hypothetical protein [Spirochaetales bacterium]
MKGKKYFLSGSVPLLIIILSCTTLPEGKSPSIWPGILPEKDSLYISITGPERIQSLLYDILSLADISIPDVSKILSKTNDIYASIHIRENLPPFFSIALAGRYSRLCMGVGLNISRTWQKDPGTERFWEHKKTHIKIALPDNHHILITNHDMNSFLSSFKSPGTTTLPDKVLSSIEHRACTLFFPHFGEEVIPERIPINKKKLPVQEVVLSTDLDMDNDTFFIDASFNLVKEENARLFQTTFKTFIIWLMRQAKIDSFTQRVTVNTNDHLVQTLAAGFTEQEMIRILKVLLSVNTLL